jgi:hypothetical protein
VLNWKIGVEIELIAPIGKTRADLAWAIAQARGGRVRRFFHRQAEPIKTQNQSVFENLTLGFEAIDAKGAVIARFVDDLTLQADCERNAAPLPGWYRIVADDARFLSLITRHCDPHAPLEAVLDPIAALFGTAPQRHPSGMVRVSDDQDQSIAIGAPLPGQRERPCEIITPPLFVDQEEALEALLAPARAAGFAAPIEGATHIHFDAAPLTEAATIARLAQTLLRHGAQMKRLLGANPNCVRLGAWPAAFAALSESPAFAALDWPSARAAMLETGLSKYCDYNLINIAKANAAKHTFELRVLPTHLHARPIMAAGELFAGLLRWCVETAGAPLAIPETLPGLIAALQLPEDLSKHWKAQALKSL